METIIFEEEGSSLSKLLSALEMAKKDVPYDKSVVGEMVTAEQQRFLSAIDHLRELGVNEDVSLPQVC